MEKNALDVLMKYALEEKKGMEGIAEKISANPDLGCVVKNTPLGDAWYLKCHENRQYIDVMEKVQEYRKALKRSQYRGIFGKILKITDRLGLTSKYRRNISLRKKHESITMSAFEARKSLQELLERIGKEEKKAAEDERKVLHEDSVSKAYGHFALYAIRDSKERITGMLGHVMHCASNPGTALSALENNNEMPSTDYGAAVLSRRTRFVSPALSQGETNRPELKVQARRNEDEISGAAGLCNLFQARQAPVYEAAVFFTEPVPDIMRQEKVA